MKKKLLITVLLGFATAIVLSGCGHSATSTFTGKSINVGYNPNTSEFGIQYKDGTIIASVTKENTISNVEIDNSTTTDSEGSVSTTGVTKFTHETKSQINGYFVDAIEAGATVDELKGVGEPVAETVAEVATEAEAEPVAEAETVAE